MVGVHRSARRALPLLVAGALLAGALASISSTARAATGPLAYTCDYGSALSDQDVPRSVSASIDTDAPATSPVGAALEVSTTVELTMPAATYAALEDAVPGFDALHPTSDLGVQETYIGPDGSWVSMAAHPDLRLAAPAEDQDAVFTGRSGAPNAINPGPKTPGTYTVTVAAVTFVLGVGSAASAYTVTCTPAAGTAVVDTMVVTDTTITTLSPLSATWTYGDAIATTATVTRTPPPATSASTVPAGWPALTGSVRFSAGSGPGDWAVTVPLAADGTATVSLSALPPGGHTISATYLPGPAGPYLTSTSGPIDVTVDVATDTALLVAPPMPEIDDLVRATATVTGRDGSQAPGEVTFLLDDTPFQTVPLSGGTAILAVPTDVAGHHTVTAVYAGDGIYLASRSEARSVDVRLHATSTTLSLDPSVAAYGEPVTATALVTSAHDGLAGTMNFTVGGRTVETPVVDGAARAVLPTLVDGDYDVTASFVPADPDTFAGSSSAQRLLVGPATTTTTLLLSRRTVKYDDTVAATARVTAAAGVPTGTVTFTVGRHGVVSAALVRGVARAVLQHTTPGGHPVVARFVPSAAGSFRSSTSAPARYTVLREVSWITAKIKKAKHGRLLRCTFVVRAGHGRPVSGALRVVLNSHGRMLRSRAAWLADGRGTTHLKSPRGQWSVVATYLGNETVAASTAVRHGHSRR